MFSPSIVRPAFVRNGQITSTRAMCSALDGSKSGSIREAGGAFGELEKARENQYFRKLEAEQLKKLHDHHEEEIRHHKELIASHEDAIKRHADKIKELKKPVGQ